VQRWFHVAWYITAKCNRHCEYCYYRSNIPDLLPVSDFVQWLQNWILQYQFERVRIAFLGGEPLLAKDKIYEFFSRWKEINRSFPDHVINCVFFTNGDYLGEDVLRKLKQYKDEGWKIQFFIHPAEDDLREVQRKVDQVKRHYQRAGLAVALSEYNLQRIDDIITFALKNERIQLHLLLLYEGGQNPDYVRLAEERVPHAIKKIVDSGVIWNPNLLLETMFITDGPFFESPYACGHSLIAVDPDGTIRSCGSDVESKIGKDIYTVELRDIQQHQKWELSSVCKDCLYRYWCYSGCPLKRKLANMEKTPYCKVVQQSMPYLLQLGMRYREEKN